jgi:hypothetical protein
MAREPQVESPCYAVKPIGTTVKKAAKKEVETGIFVCPEGSFRLCAYTLGCRGDGEVCSIA